MEISLDLLKEALVAGVLLGCFYAAVSVGLSVAFGLLDVPHIAHPAFMVLGSYCTWMLGARLGLDPILAGVVLMPFFFVFGIAVYRFYYETFEKRGTDVGVRGLAFFFGVAFIVEVGLILAFGVDQRMVEASYIGDAWELGDMRIPMRMIVAFATALVLTSFLALYLSKTFTGRAIKAVAQDEGALRLMGVNPVRIKQWAFGIATAVTAAAGAMLIVVSPVDPSIDRIYIGRTFCVVVLAGLGSMKGTVVAGLILGIAESIVLSMPELGASWANAVSFGILLIALGVRPQGLFGR
jgi:branched-chain amino acid transport system permease protein